MATINMNTAYAGEFAGKYIAPALLGANTVLQGGVEVMQNIPYRSTLKKIDEGSLLADATCDFSDGGTITLSDRVLEVKELQVNRDVCILPFRRDWEALKTGNSMMQMKLPKNFETFLVNRFTEKIAQQSEKYIWNGLVGTAGQFGGFVPKIEVDAGLPAAQEVTGTTVDKSNVIDELGKIYDAIPNRLYGREGLKMYISQNIMRAYVISLGGFGANGQGANGYDGKGQMWYNGQPLNFGGVPLFMANGLNDNQAIVTYKENLFFGVSSLADLTKLQLLDMSKIDGSDNVRVIMKMAAGTQYGNIEDIVTYGITNSAND